jgi:hypothetical protein
MFSNLAYQPEVIQADGGFVCGPLACQTLADLLQTEDATHCTDHYHSRPINSIRALNVDEEKSELLRKSILESHMTWLYDINGRNELNAKTRYEANIGAIDGAEL